MSTEEEDAERVVKNSWTPEEDALLRDQIEKHGGPGNWTAIAEALVGRSSKSCRLRWCNQLNPTVKRGPFTEEEDQKILAAHAVYGNKWAVISRSIPGRTDNQVKNRFNSTLRRVLAARAREPFPGMGGKRRRLESAPGFFAPGSPNASGKSGNSSETRVGDGDDASDEDGAIMGLEQLVQASMQVEKRERPSPSGGGMQGDTHAKAFVAGGAQQWRAAEASGPAEAGEHSVRAGQMFTDHASLLSAMQLQQQLQQQIARIAAVAYPGFHAPCQTSGDGAAHANNTKNENAPNVATPASTGSSAGADAQTLFAQNSMLQALQAHISLEQNARLAHSQVNMPWGFPQQFGATGDMAVAHAILAAGQNGSVTGFGSWK